MEMEMLLTKMVNVSETLMYGERSYIKVSRGKLLKIEGHMIVVAVGAYALGGGGFENTPPQLIWFNTMSSSFRNLSQAKEQ